MDQNEQKIFFDILAASIWERIPDTTSWNITLETWDHVLQMMINHDLIGVVAHTVMSLPEGIMPSIQWQMELSIHVARLTQAHESINTAIVEIFTALEDAGCNPLLLKGQGIAPFYPKTCLRSCGDIDCYVGMDKFQKSKDVMQTLCTPDDFSNGKLLQHQFDLQYKDITVELHRRLSETPVEWYEKRFQRMFRTYLASSTSTVEIAQERIRVLNPQYNALYVFVHLAHHYAFQGIGFRQFIDLAMILHHDYRNINTKQLKSDLEESGCLQAWQILSGILHYQLGMPQIEIPLYDSTLANRSQGNVLDCIINGWNFGNRDKKSGAEDVDYSMNNKLSHKISKLMSIYKKSQRSSDLFPHITFLNIVSTFIHGVQHRWQRIRGTYEEFCLDF